MPYKGVGGFKIRNPGEHVGVFLSMPKAAPHMLIKNFRMESKAILIFYTATHLTFHHSNRSTPSLYRVEITRVQPTWAETGEAVLALPFPQEFNPEKAETVYTILWPSII